MFEAPFIRRILGIILPGLCLAGPAFADADRPMSDPTRPAGWQAAGVAQVESAKQPLGALRLQGTFSQAGDMSAMISGRRVSVGDEVSGAKVIAIEKNRVTLRLGAETIELASVWPEVKSPTGVEGDER